MVLFGGMPMFSLEENVTSLVDSTRLAEAGIELEADGYWVYLSEDCSVEGKLPRWEFGTKHKFIVYFRIGLEELNYIGIKAYRLDRLLAELPEWCFRDDRTIDEMITKTRWTTKKKNKYFLSLASRKHLRGQEAIKACVDLLILLREEGKE